MSHYAAAKANVLRFQARGDTCVLNADDVYTGPWLRSGRCEIAAGEGQEEVYFPIQATRLGFSLAGEVESGAFLRGDALIWRRSDQSESEICRTEEVRLRGRHNLANILAAACLAGVAGADVQAMRAVATTFGGVAHRLQIVRQRDGVLWINDSIATAPERTVADLRSFAEPIVALLGGRDKHLPWGECAAELHRWHTEATPHVRHVVLFGEAADLIAEALARHVRESGDPPVPLTRCADLVAAVAVAAAVAQPGDVVLLAPGGTSFDAYEDFAARAAFRGPRGGTAMSFEAPQHATPVAPRGKVTNQAATVTSAPDYPLIVIMATLLGLGLFMVYSASFTTQGTAFFTRQIAWIALGVLACGIMAFIPHDFWRQLAVPILVGTMVLLAAVLLLGSEKTRCKTTSLWKQLSAQ